MRIYKIPFNVKREEKIFGGYLSLRQVIYLSIAGACCFLAISPIPLILKYILIPCSVIFLLLCAFLKIGEQSFDKYFFYALKFLFRKRKYVYERCLE